MTSASTTDVYYLPATGTDVRPLQRTSSPGGTMKRSLPLLLLLLPACALFQRPFHPEHASPEEAEQVKFPDELPAETRLKIPGVMATAIQLAMDDFRPRPVKTFPWASPEQSCLYQRESYNVDASPGPEGIVFVRFALAPNACPEVEDAPNDLGAIYAIDVRKWRILASQY